MKFGFYGLGALFVLASFLAIPAGAQEVQCIKCYLSEVTLNSYCQPPLNGSWPNCETRCTGWECSCVRGQNARCVRGADGIWLGFRVQEVYRVPVDQPFYAAQRVTRATMKHRPA